MPMPKPKAAETKEKFVARFMANPAMQEDYPDEKQRLAVAYRQYGEPASESTKSIPVTEMLRARRHTAGKGLMRAMSPEPTSDPYATAAAATAILDSPIYFDETVVDRDKMCIGPITISTIDEDRYEDVIEPLGGQWDNYEKNPIIMLDHGLDHKLPIGKSMDEDGNLTIVVGKTQIDATGYFSKSSPEAYQAFGLVAEGILRGTSIHVTPLQAFRRSEGTPAGGRPGFLVTEWEMIEWSLGAIPVNPNCLAKVFDTAESLLSTGRIGGDALLEPIRKLLSPLAPKRTKQQVRGHSPSEEPIMATALDLSLSFDPAAPLAEFKKTLAAALPAGAPAALRKAVEGMSEEGNIVPLTKDEGEPDADDRTEGERQTAAHLEALRGHAENLTHGVTKVEHPEVKEHLGSHAETIQGMIGETEKAMKMYYPDSDSLKKTEDEPDEKEKEANLEKFIRGGRPNQLRLAGMAHSLRTLAMAKNISASQRYDLTTKAGSLEKMLAKREDDLGLSPTQAEQVAELIGMVKTLKQQLDDATPKNK